MFCGVCGKESKQANFCWHCGLDLRSEENLSKEISKQPDLENNENSSKELSKQPDRLKQLVQSFAHFKNEKGSAWKARVSGRHPPKKDSKVKEDVDINIGLFEWDNKDKRLKIRRAKRILCKVSPNDNALNIRIKGEQKFSKYFCNLYDEQCTYKLVYESAEEVEKMPGSNEPFILHKYKSELGRDYKRITLYLCKSSDLLISSYGDIEEEEEEGEEEEVNDSNKSKKNNEIACKKYKPSTDLSVYLENDCSIPDDEMNSLFNDTLAGIDDFGRCLFVQPQQQQQNQPVSQQPQHIFQQKPNSHGLLENHTTSSLTIAQTSAVSTTTLSSANMQEPITNYSNHPPSVAIANVGCTTLSSNPQVQMGNFSTQTPLTIVSAVATTSSTPQSNPQVRSCNPVQSMSTVHATSTPTYMPTSSKSTNSSNAKKNVSTCCICLEVITTNPCHPQECSCRFHTECIQEWILVGKECPSCHTTIYEVVNESFGDMMGYFYHNFGDSVRMENSDRSDLTIRR